MRRPLEGCKMLVKCDNRRIIDDRLPDLEYREMLCKEAGYVAELYSELAFCVRSQSQDDYFDFDAIDKEAITEQLRAAACDPMRKVCVAVEKGKIVGFMAGEITNCFLSISKTKKIGYISAAYLLPSYRGQGIMAKMEKQMTAFFKENRLSYVELHVLSNNASAKKCWEGMQYSTFREQMRKKIDQG